jgi:hypothetical protein
VNDFVILKNARYATITRGAWERCSKSSGRVFIFVNYGMEVVVNV